MGKDKIDRPTKEHFDQFDLANASSATECTGLITHFPTDEDLEAYMDVYSFQATPYLYEDEKDKNDKNKI